MKTVWHQAMLACKTMPDERGKKAYKPTTICTISSYYLWKNHILFAPMSIFLDDCLRLIHFAKGIICIRLFASIQSTLSHWYLSLARACICIQTDVFFIILVVDYNLSFLVRITKIFVTCIWLGLAVQNGVVWCGTVLCSIAMKFGIIW